MHNHQYLTQIIKRGSLQNIDPNIIQNCKQTHGYSDTINNVFIGILVKPWWIRFLNAWLPFQSNTILGFISFETNGILLAQLETLNDEQSYPSIFIPTQQIQSFKNPSKWSIMIKTKHRKYHFKLSMAKPVPRFQKINLNHLNQFVQAYQSR